MVIYVTEGGSDRQELIEELVKEGLTFKGVLRQDHPGIEYVRLADGGSGSQSA